LLTVTIDGKSSSLCADNKKAVFGGMEKKYEKSLFIDPCDLCSPFARHLLLFE
jgi:hypothetical protein